MPRQAAAALVPLEVAQVELEGGLEVLSNRQLALLVLAQGPHLVVAALVPLEVALEAVSSPQAVLSVPVQVLRLRVAVGLAPLEVALEAINNHQAEVLVLVQARKQLVPVSLALLVVEATRRSQAVVVSLALSVVVVATKRRLAVAASLVRSVPEPTSSHLGVRSVLVPAPRSLVEVLVPSVVEETKRMLVEDSAPVQVRKLAEADLVLLAGVETNKLIPGVSEQGQVEPKAGPRDLDLSVEGLAALLQISHRVVGLVHLEGRLKEVVTTVGSSPHSRNHQGRMVVVRSSHGDL